MAPCSRIHDIVWTVYARSAIEARQSASILLRHPILRAGPSFVMCLLIVDAGHGSQEDLVLVPALHATLFGLFSIPCNLLASRDYVWGPASAAGIAVGAVSASTFAALLMWKQASKSRPKGGVASLQSRRGPLQAVCTPRSDIEHQMSALLLSPEPPEDDSSFRIDMPSVPEARKPFKG
ncbi:hypothetical protein PMIN01_12063 [Paraphaeosphaeria minitans]|uniref:Uncharacterized protein n=1 Tax=Paraphaeosphaeria minitans TaxID=565426 RepID=A0A9P6G672_9PLEO|nr:hypothetical protein PMIN01_13322 [Paraphaeosphaeria minitans]KAF9730130.1 hypothetical protein PMIN01_12063 [Paraphaeosphaeria minitans]